MDKASLERLENTPWNYGNSFLCGMCKSNPDHKDPDKAFAKIWIIGRSYSAAIERGAGKYQKEGIDFYPEKVGPMLTCSDIDSWIKELNLLGRPTTANVESLLEIHFKFVIEIEKITGKKNRSLASKYLHFHAPQAVFIFDSIADKALRAILRKQQTRFDYKKGYDDAYCQFVARCLYLRDNIIEPKLGKKVAPRFIDNILLAPSSGQL